MNNNIIKIKINKVSAIKLILIRRINYKIINIKINKLILIVLQIKIF
jgi:hypothetical protein